MELSKIEICYNRKKYCFILYMLFYKREHVFSLGRMC